MQEQGYFNSGTELEYVFIRADRRRGIEIYQNNTK